MPDIERSRSVRFHFMLYAQFGVINKDIISLKIQIGFHHYKIRKRTPILIIETKC